jgi:hypothetical protein
MIFIMSRGSYNFRPEMDILAIFDPLAFQNPLKNLRMNLRRMAHTILYIC